MQKPKDPNYKFITRTLKDEIVNIDKVAALDINNYPTYADVPKDVDGNPIMNEDTFAALKKAAASDHEFAQVVNLLGNILKGYATSKDLNRLWMSATKAFADKHLEAKILDNANKVQAILSTISQLTTVVAFQKALQVLTSSMATKSDIADVSQIVSAAANEIGIIGCAKLNFTIPHDQVLTLKDTGFVLVAPFNSASWLKIEALTLSFPYAAGKVEYTVADPTDALCIQYSGISEIANIPVTGFLDQTSVQERALYGAPWNGVSSRGASLVLKMTGHDLTLGNVDLTGTIYFETKT